MESERGQRVGRWWKRSRSSALEVGARLPFSGVAVRVFARDKHAAGTVLGSALALRLFLFFVPMVLFLFGVAGILGRYSNVNSSSDVGIGGALGDELDTTFRQDGLAPWIAVVAGIVSMAWAGRSLSRALVVSSALSWQMGGNQPLRIRVIGVVVGILVGLSLTWVLINEIRQAAGIAVASVSFVGVAGIYLVLWSVLYIALPHRDQRSWRGASGRGGDLGGADLAPRRQPALPAPEDQWRVVDVRHLWRRCRHSRLVLHHRACARVHVRVERCVVRGAWQYLPFRVRASGTPHHPPPLRGVRPILRSSPTNVNDARQVSTMSITVNDRSVRSDGNRATRDSSSSSATCSANCLLSQLVEGDNHGWGHGWGRGCE